MESWYSFTWLRVSVPLTFLLPLLVVVVWTKVRNSATKRRPPGPTGWPVIGNMFDLGATPHQDLYKLRFKYGPVIWLKFGSVNTMVIQSPKAAAELFKNHDSTFCDRKVTEVMRSCSYNQGSLALSKYGPYWRIIRRLCSSELLVSKRVNSTAALREKCVQNMTRWIEDDSKASRASGGSGEVQISRFLLLMSFNVVGNLMLSRDLLEPQSDKGREFLDAMEMVMEFSVKPNVADFLPFLKWMDPMGIKRNMEHHMGRALKIVAEFVTERVQQKKHAGTEKVNKDFLDVLLEYDGDGKEGPHNISERNVTIIILEMFFAGSETTSSTIEWAMVELLCNPDSMRKVKEEINSIIGLDQKVEEKNMDELPYLQAVVKETLRLHPPVPLLVPRDATKDSNYMGYEIPKNTQVLVNAWAIGRDAESWDDPLSFKPERFLGKNIEYYGQHFELIPFGSGRRICVGFALGERVVHLALATLIQSFDWEVSNARSPEIADMTERMGITLRKLVPLKAIPTKRNSTQGSPINLSEILYSLMNTITLRAALGKKKEDQGTLKQLLKEVVDARGGFEVGYFFPSIKILPTKTGQKAKLEKIHRELDWILDGIVDGHKDRREAIKIGEGKGSEDLLDVLLRVQENGELEFPFTTENVKAIILVVVSMSTLASIKIGFDPKCRIYLRLYKFTMVASYITFLSKFILLKSTSDNT
ncbi:hypothetical protein Vadar_009729 [Vaccinium darrowii]|uniref:Uncharacterized protein n=1 Tax=Vaccinium darrowii TaxID=229202 RepID=A0ACB7YU31_9ERIC|nr:hypothetical protein Vadar_009729 [Vaccinium darrowii]